ncbi:helix-turn-helix domain-containing protein, partial [Pseudomonas aeruginosa]
MPRPARHDRQQALDRAVDLFWERGYHATSMKHIEQALDMRPGSLYATFGSKGNSEKDFLIWQNTATPPTEFPDEADDLRRRRVRWQ